MKYNIMVKGEKMEEKINIQKEVINEIIKSICCEVIQERESLNAIILSVKGTSKEIAQYNIIIAEKITENDFLDDYPKVVRFSSL